MKKLCDSMSDIISNLPAVILENILMCMPLRDAVRTSVLSTKWRYNWALIPQLVFDDSILTIVPGQNSLITRHKLLVIISHTLMLHRTPILKFTLSICELESGPEIDNLISFLTSHGVEELALRFWKGELYKLPSSLFSCQQLKHLILRHCIFIPSMAFEGFNRVICMELSEVSITKDSFARLISSCSLLEQLKVENLTNCDLLEIDSWSLKSSYFVGKFKSICFKNAPHLAVVSLLLSRVPVSSVELPNGNLFGWFEFVTNLPALENLEMDEYYMKSLASSDVANQLYGVWCNLISSRKIEILKLYGVCLDYRRVIRVALSLMISPKLQNCALEVYSTKSSVKVQKYLQKCQKLCFVRIREVQLGITSGTAVELDFIKLLLARSRVLEKMVVKPDEGKVWDGGLKILKELTVFERLSPKAKVIYKDPDS